MILIWFRQQLLWDLIEKTHSNQDQDSVDSVQQKQRRVPLFLLSRFGEVCAMESDGENNKHQNKCLLDPHSNHVDMQSSQYFIYRFVVS
jgi:hypothetical protein